MTENLKDFDIKDVLQDVVEFYREYFNERK